MGPVLLSAHCGFSFQGPGASASCCSQSCKASIHGSQKRRRIFSPPCKSPDPKFHARWKGSVPQSIQFFFFPPQDKLAGQHLPCQPCLGVGELFPLQSLPASHLTLHSDFLLLCLCLLVGNLLSHATSGWHVHKTLECGSVPAPAPGQFPHSAPLPCSLARQAVSYHIAKRIDKYISGTDLIAQK